MKTNAVQGGEKSCSLMECFSSAKDCSEIIFFGVSRVSEAFCSLNTGMFRIQVPGRGRLWLPEYPTYHSQSAGP